MNDINHTPLASPRSAANSASIASSRVFIEDLGADGLQAQHEEGAAFDSIDRGGKRTVFDNDWRKEQKLTEEQFAKLFGDADALYARLLQALVSQAKK